jgi:hypothetical protein
MAVLIALLTLIAGIAVGVWLFAADHLVIGLAVFLASLPLALAAWMLVNDRRGL